MSEYTYLMFDGYHYKIGRSIDPKKRLKQFETGNPRIRLVAFGNGITENLLHINYKKYNVGGEWFFLQEYQIQMILILLKPIFYDKEYIKNTDKKNFQIDYYCKLLNEKSEIINYCTNNIIKWQDAYRKKSNDLRKLQIEKKFSIKKFFKFR